MKTLISSLTFFVSLSTLLPALAFSQPLLSYYEASGFVAPQHRFSRSCEIYSDHVVRTNQGASSEQTQPESTQVVWTARVPNVQTIINLLVEASSGEVRTDSPMMDAGIRTYKGFVPGFERTKETILRSIGGVNKENTSLAAKRLVKFLDRNCK